MSGKPTYQQLVSMVNSLANMLLESEHSSNDLDYANDCLDAVIPLLFVDPTAASVDVDDRSATAASVDDGPKKHRLAMTGITPGKPDQYRAQCGYTSSNGGEFTIRGKVTCEACNA